MIEKVLQWFVVPVLVGAFVAGCSMFGGADHSLDDAIFGSEAFAASTSPTSSVYTLGDTEVEIRVTPKGATPIYIALHNNENTSVRAAKKVIDQKGGTLVELIHSGSRNIEFTYKGKKYRFDPNRIFSDKGIEKTLKELSGSHSKEAHMIVRLFSEAVLAKLRGGTIIALHNNSPGTYSVNSYTDGKSLRAESKKVSVNSEMDIDDFFFVTNASLFEKLKAKGFNVVLQADRPTDDGSLSVYAARNSIEYVNVEAEAGHEDVQVTMIEALQEALP